jgi:hypothetical protein
MAKAQSFEAPGVACTFRHTIVRESTDKMFRSDETWLCAFVPQEESLTLQQVQIIVDAAVAADVRFLLVVAFGTVSFDVEDQLRRGLGEQDMHVAMLAGPLANCLMKDFGQSQPSAIVSQTFSFGYCSACGSSVSREE